MFDFTKSGSPEEKKKWEGLLTPSKNRLPADLEMNQANKSGKNEIFSIDESAYAIETHTTRKKLTMIAKDINENSLFAFEKQKWCINEYSKNNSLLKTIMIEQLSHKFGINIKSDDVLCFILHWKEKNEAICFTGKTTSSYATYDKPDDEPPQDGTDEANFYKSDAPELIIYTEDGEKYNVRMPSWTRDKFYKTLKITDSEPLLTKQDKAEPPVPPNPPVKPVSSITPLITPVPPGTAPIIKPVPAVTDKPKIPVIPEEPVTAVTDEPQKTEEPEVKLPVPEASNEQKPEPIAVLSKYCNSIYNCLQIYYENAHICEDGSLAKIEVPADKYSNVLQSMEDVIVKGVIDGLLDTGEAPYLIRKGMYTYKQIMNMARANTITGILFDSKQECVITEYPTGLSTAVSYAVSIWSGDDTETALKKAAYTGIQVNNTAFITALLSIRLTAEEMAGVKKGNVEAISFYIGEKAAGVLSAIYRGKVHVPVNTENLSPKPDEIAAILKKRILNGRLYTGASQTKKDENKSFWGKVKSLFTKADKPSAVTHDVYRFLNEDAIDLMLAFIAKTFVQLSEDFLLNAKESDWIKDRLCTILTGRTIREIYLSENRVQVVDELIRPIIWSLITRRKRITPPDARQLFRGLILALDDIADEQLK